MSAGAKINSTAFFLDSGCATVAMGRALPQRAALEGAAAPGEHGGGGEVS